MFRFFRNIRLKMIHGERARGYTIYAVGEILLIVFGILIALQINNWNEAKKKYDRESKLLQELATNLETNIENLEKDIASQIKSSATIYFLLDHLDNQRPYYDSLDFLFGEADFVTVVVLASSAFETLKSTGLELIRSDNLHKENINLFEVTYPTLLQETKRYEDQIWPAASIPLYQKHFRRERQGLTKPIARPIDYDKLLEDKEFTNMLSFRVNLREYSTEQKQIAVKKTKEVIQLIRNELGEGGI